MKKLFILLSIIFFSTNVVADTMKKNGFLNNKMDYSKNQNIDDPKNKIILIYNHGQDDHDDPSNNCVWKNGIRNFSSLVGEKINEKEIIGRTTKTVIENIYQRFCQSTNVNK